VRQAQEDLLCPAVKPAAKMKPGKQGPLGIVRAEPRKMGGSPMTERKAGRVRKQA
jgi:hypothetical protein